MIGLLLAISYSKYLSLPIKTHVFPSIPKAIHIAIVHFQDSEPSAQEPPPPEVPRNIHHPIERETLPTKSTQVDIVKININMLRLTNLCGKISIDSPIDIVKILFHTGIFIDSSTFTLFPETWVAKGDDVFPSATKGLFS